MFCSSCGAHINSSAKFCSSCGQKVERAAAQGNTAEVPTPGNNSPQCLTFQNYAAKKTEERSTFFRSGSKKKATKAKDDNPFAIINIGIMRYVNPDLVAPVRGKVLPLKVKKDAGYAEVFTEALLKRQAHDQTFDRNGGWKLVYPDGQIAITLPGQAEEDFTLRKYKVDLGKQYSRITLYLCPDEPDAQEHDDEQSEINTR